MAVPTRIQINSEFLKNLHSSSNAKTFIKEAKNDQILSLVEICYNLIKFRYFLNRRQLEALRKFAPQIRQLAKIRRREKAEKILIQLPVPFYRHLLTPLLQRI